MILEKRFRKGLEMCFRKVETEEKKGGNIVKKKVIIFLSVLMMLLFAQGVTVFAGTMAEGYYRLRNVNSDLYMNYADIINTSNIYQEYYDDANMAKSFLIVHTHEDGYYNIRPYDAQNMVVEVMDGVDANFANIYLHVNELILDNEKWKFIYNDNGSFRIMSKCSNNTKGMTVINASVNPGANIFQCVYGGPGNDQWYLEKVIEEGTYFIRNKQTGLYLALCNDSIWQTEFTENVVNQSNYKFKITKSDDGYYYIRPANFTEFDVCAVGWNNNSDGENAAIILDKYNDATDENNKWRFIANGDGSCRITSFMSGCTKAITSNSATDKNLYSCTYKMDLNANWELIQTTPVTAEEMNTYYDKEGEHVIVSLDTDAYLKNNISAEKFNEWIDNLDKCYEKYYELVGAYPQSGEKLWIIPGIKEKRNNSDYDYGLYAYQGQKIICWKKDGIIDALQKTNKTGDWNFGVLHEMGHTFDVDPKSIIHPRYDFDTEFWANFKMVYVLKQLDGQFYFDMNGIGMVDGVIEDITIPVNSYADLKQFYKEGSGSSYVYHASRPYDLKANEVNDSLTYMFLESIDSCKTYNYWNSIAIALENLRNSDVEYSESRVKRWEYFFNAVNDATPNGVDALDTVLNSLFEKRMERVMEYYTLYDNE